MSRFVSLMEGPFAREWEEVGLGKVRVASHRATTSSRTPGKVNRGVVYATDFAHAELHIHTCGLSMHRCRSCFEWICTAPGHLEHVCEGAT